MPDVEIKRKVRLSREEAAQRLIDIGNALADSSKSRLHFDGDSIHFTVADQVEFEFELEVEGDQTELEIELKWSDASPSEPSAAPDQP